MLKRRLGAQVAVVLFVATLAMEELGADKFFDKVGSEPTGRAFNSVPAVADMPTHTGNPHVSAGAILTVSLISGRTADEKWAKILNFYSRAAGEKLVLIDEVYKSEGGHERRQQSARFGKQQMFTEPGPLKFNSRRSEA